MERLDETSKAFLAYLRHECGVSENTLKAYALDTRRFLHWLTDAGVNTWNELNIARLGKYVDFLQSEKLAVASIARHVASLKMFFRFLVLDERIEASVAELLNRPSLWERLPFVLSERQAAALLAAPEPSDKLFARDRALLEMMYATGARASEIADLKTDDVRLAQRYCRCFGKGRKERIVPFHPGAQASLMLYMMQFRPALLEHREDPKFLFLTRAAKPMTRIDIWRIVKKYARRLGMAERVSPHTLRHSFATHMLSQGADLRVIQELLGHARITTTQHYTRVDAQRLKKVHKQFHPRA